MREKILSLLGLLALAGCATRTAPQSSTAVTRVELAAPVVASAPAGAPAFWPENAPSIRARNAILIDARTGRTLYQKYADTPTQVASTQKLVTALVILDRGGLGDSLTVSPAATSVEPAKLGLKGGQSYTRIALLSAMMVKSENDAAAALAYDCCGSMGTFAEAMNRKAWSLGARNSHFLNAHGLPAPQHSTARDMAKVAFAAYHEPILRRLMNTQYYTFVFSDGRTKSLETTNKLLRRSSVYNGMKTGYTFAAGRCLISSAALNGREVILVQLGSKTSYIFDDAERLMQWGLSRGTFAMF